jgi:hypothetical protein
MIERRLLAALALGVLLGCNGVISSTPAEGQPPDGGARREAERASLAEGFGRRRADAGAQLDAGHVVPETDGGPVPGIDAGGGCVGAGCTCVRATELWREDFETGDHSRWTGRSYGDSWGDACQGTALSTLHPRGGLYSQRSEIVCASSSPDGVHRGYGGLQWSGDRVLADYTNTGTGLAAPNGIVTTFHVWLEAGYALGDGRWVSLFTVNPSCDYSERVITLGLDQPDGVLRPAHHWPEGTLAIEPGAPALPRDRWVRLTVFLSFESGEMHVWQDGRSVLHVSGIARATRTMCQWHWGLYASGDNTDVALYEDDKIVWRLEQPWTDWSREPWLGESQAVCP